MSDLISRQTAIDALEAKKDKTAKGTIGQFYNTIIQLDIDALIDLPTIDAVEVKHGEWMEEGSSCSYIFHCSVCGGVAYFVHGKGRGRNIERRFCGYRYCPNCGAKMDGERR